MKKKAKRIMKKKSEHHMWNAQSDDNGQVTINRNTAEREEFEESDFLMAVTASSWGFFGASLVDQFSKKVPAAEKSRFQLVAKTLKASGEKPPRVRSWEELRKAFGNDEMSEAREFISDGMKVRQASKFLNLPFIIAADLVDEIEVVGKKAMKDIVKRVKKGDKKVVKDYGKVASSVKRLYDEALREGNTKIAIDDSAKDYWTQYYGEYGEQLVGEVKKRVKADVAYEWLRRNGVDEAAAAYWANYYTDGDYGKDMVKTPEKRTTPKASRKKAQDVDEMKEALEIYINEYGTEEGFVQWFLTGVRSTASKKAQDVNEMKEALDIYINEYGTEEGFVQWFLTGVRSASRKKAQDVDEMKEALEIYINEYGTEDGFVQWFLTGVRSASRKKANLFEDLKSTLVKEVGDYINSLPAEEQDAAMDLAGQQMQNLVGELMDYRDSSMGGDVY